MIGGKYGHLPPRDRGLMLAHEFHDRSSRTLEEAIARARRRRRGLLARTIPGRGRLLDGFIDGLEDILRHRAASRGSRRVDSSSTSSSDGLVGDPTGVEGLGDAEDSPGAGPP